MGNSPGPQAPPSGTGSFDSVRLAPHSAQGDNGALLRDTRAAGWSVSSTTSLVRAQSSLTGSCSKLSWRPWSPGLRRVFFFLSGYLITSLLSNEARKTGTISLKNFYLRRVLRIFPPCYLTVIIVTTLAAMGIRVQPGKLQRRWFRRFHISQIIATFWDGEICRRVCGSCGLGPSRSMTTFCFLFCTPGSFDARLLEGNKPRSSLRCAWLRWHGVAIARFCGTHRGRISRKEQILALIRSWRDACSRSGRIPGWEIGWSG